MYAIAQDQRAQEQLYSLRADRSNRKGVADLLMYAGLVAPGVVLNKDGALMAGWELRGEDPATKSNDELAMRIAHLNAAFLGRDVGWMFHYPRSAHRPPRLRRRS